jgi:hypothetical protein
MNKTTLRNCVVAVVLSVAVAAIFSLGLSSKPSQSDVKTGIVITAYHGTLVADGSESNGGKGGGKGNS